MMVIAVKVLKVAALAGIFTAALIGTGVVDASLWWAFYVFLSVPTVFLIFCALGFYAILRKLKKAEREFEAKNGRGWSRPRENAP